MLRDVGDGMVKMMQTTDSESRRDRVTIELAQVIQNASKPDEAPRARHGMHALVVPCAHACLSNIREGCFCR